MNDDLPILGEPLAVELANTRYGEGGAAYDFLADNEQGARWLAEVFPIQTVVEWHALREVRDAVHVLLMAAAANQDLDPEAVAVVNRHAARAATRVALDLIDGERRVLASVEGDVAAVAAASCISTLAGPDPVRRCEGPGCTLLFVQLHRRRRFCHEGCSHRDRQARYRRSRR
jgi:predicted RNA-binding Zn ribbon-like protein